MLCNEQAKDVAVIPQFFFPGGPPVPEAVQRGMQAKLDSCFSSSPDGLTIPAVKDLMREVSMGSGSCTTMPDAPFALPLLSL